MISKPKKSKCFDCGWQYGAEGWVDLVLPNWAWNKISPRGNGGGILCPNCICKRLEQADIRVVRLLPDFKRDLERRSS